MKFNFKFITKETTTVKLILRLSLPLFFLFSLTVGGLIGCAASDTVDGATLSVVTTVFPPYDFTKAITDGVEGVSVTQLLRPGMESHTFDPTPADMLTVESCDIFIYTGGESDAWVETLLSAVNNPDMRVLRMMECIEHVENIPHLGSLDHTGHDHAHDSDHVDYDEHVWTHPQHAIRICEQITALLCTADAAHADVYKANLTSYTEKLWDLDIAIAETVSFAKRRTLVFGDRFPFRYLCDGYGISYHAAFPGCAAESEPSAYTMAFLIDKIQSEDIPAICKIEMSNGKIAAAIAEETGVQILTLHSCHNRTADEAEAGKTYLDLMYENVAALRIALGTISNEN